MTFIQNASPLDCKIYMHISSTCTCTCTCTCRTDTVNSKLKKISEKSKLLAQ